MRRLVSFSSYALAIGVAASTLFGFGSAVSSTPSFTDPAVAHAQASTFTETFNGKPAGPTAYRPANWDVLVHSRDVQTWQQPESMQAGHGADCSAHPASHLVNSYQDTVFQCNDHMMTAINAGGYGAIYMTPNQLVDFTDGEATISFNMSTLRTSTRDWIDVWVTPYEDNVPAPLDNWLPDLTGLPKRAVHIRMDQFNGDTNFKADVVRNFNATEIAGNWWTGYESFLTPSAVRRDTFELKISKTSVKFGMPGYNNFRWIDSSTAPLDWSRGVVQFSHHSYNPTKDCPSGTCTPNTWHWDDVSVSPAVPYTILSADRAMVMAGGPTATFGGPAPADSYLRFLGIGSGLQASYDGGPWQNLTPRQTSKTGEEAFKPFWAPVPAGTRQVTFRGTDWYGGPWAISDPAIWSLTAAGSQPAPTATSTVPAATATATGTPAQSTTATPTSTAPAASPTATAPAVTATSTATPTSVPATATQLPATATPTATQLPATPTSTATTAPVTPGGPNGSLSLAGSAHATVPNAPELALNGDWTLELWFKDEYAASGTFSHAPQMLVVAGDTDWDPDIPLMARVEWGGLSIGDRRGWEDHYVWYDLNGNVAPGVWHHLAVTKNATSRRLQVMIDGRLVVDEVLQGQNPAPNGKGLSIGRNGRQHNWRGKLDDIRIWNVARSVADINASFRSELSGTPAGLVANWKLNEKSGTSIADSAGSPQDATMRGKGIWSTDVHP